MSTRPPSPDPLDLARHAAGVRRLAKRLVRSHDAEDVAQEAVIRGIERPAPKGYAPAAWIRGIVRNVARERRRSEGRRVRREASALPRGPISADVAAAAGEAEQVRVLADAMARLPEAYRAVVWWRYFADQTPKEIGALLGEPPATVRARLKRALDRLRSDLDADHGGDGIGWRAAIAPLAGFVPAVKGGAVASAMHWSTTCVIVLLSIGAGLGLFAWSPWDSQKPHGDEAPLPARQQDEAVTLTGRAAKDRQDAPMPVRGRSLTVTVIADDSGEPISGAHVRVYRDSLKHGPCDGLTDGRGEVRLKVSDVGPLTVYAWAKAFFAREPTRIAPTPGSELRVTIRLERGEVLAGRVSLPDGTAPTKPVELRIFVHLRGTSGPGRGSKSSTGADGTFLAEGLRPGSANISVIHTEGGRRYVARKLVQTGEGDVHIELREPQPGDRVRFEVRLQDAAGRPVEAKGLRVIGRRGHTGSRHEFDGWSGSSAEVEMWYDPGIQLFIEVFDVATDLGAVLHGPVSLNELGVTVTVESGRTLNGVVRGPGGEPVAGVGIGARALYPFGRRSASAGSIHARSETDQHGRFELHRLAACAYRLEFAVPAGFAHPGELRVPPDKRDLSIDLEAGTTATLTVVDDEDRPVQGAQASVYAVRPGTVPGSLSARMNTFHETISTASTDERGRVQLTGFAAGRRYILVVEGGRRPKWRRIEMKDWSPVDGRVLFGESKPIQGRVVYADGTPAMGGHVTWWREGTSTIHSTPALPRSARFRIETEAGGRWLLRAESPSGGTSDPLSVEAGARNVVLVVLQRTERWIRIVDCRLEDALKQGILALHRDGSEPTYTSVSLQNDGRIDLGRHPQATAFSLWVGPLAGGRYVYVVERALPTRGETLVGPQPGEVLAGRVVAPAGVKLEALVIEIGAPLRQDGAHRPTDWITARCDVRAGTFRVPGLPAVQTVVRARAYAKKLEYVAEVEATPGDQVVLTLKRK